MAQEKFVNVGSLANNNYAQHLGVTIYSMLKNCSDAKRIRLFIVDGDISEINKKKLDAVTEKFGVKINYVKPDLAMLEGVKIQKQFSIATYYKFCLLEKAPVDKLLYIDSDLVIEKDVIELYNNAFEGNLFFGIEDTDMPIRNKKNIGLSEKDPYFNAGVLLIDLKRWKKEKTTKKAIEYIKNHIESIEFSDQDGLNAVSKGKWKKIDPSWDALAKLFYSLYIPFKHSKTLSRKEIYKLSKKKLIIHYAGFLKPWYTLDIVPFKRTYQKYVMETPWKDTKYIDNGFSKTIHRMVDYSNYVWKRLTHDTN